MTNKKLGLLLLPLLPLSAIGIVEVASAIAPKPVAAVEAPMDRCDLERVQPPVDPVSLPRLPAPPPSE